MTFRYIGRFCGKISLESGQKFCVIEPQTNKEKPSGFYKSQDCEQPLCLYLNNLNLLTKNEGFFSTLTPKTRCFSRNKCLWYTKKTNSYIHCYDVRAWDVAKTHWETTPDGCAAACLVWSGCSRVGTLAKYLYCHSSRLLFVHLHCNETAAPLKYPLPPQTPISTWHMYSEWGVSHIRHFSRNFKCSHI